MGSEDTGYVYDEAKVGDFDMHQFRAGKETFIEDLSKRFPQERAALEEYIKLVKEVNKKSDIHFFGKLFSPWVERLVEWAAGSRFQELASQTVSQVLDRLFVSSELKAILASQFGDYGTQKHLLV